MSTADFLAANPHIGALPSPRERLAHQRFKATGQLKELETDLDDAARAAKRFTGTSTEGASIASLLTAAASFGRVKDRLFMCDLADILLDAIEAR